MKVTVKIGGLSELGKALHDMGDEMVMRSAKRMSYSAAKLVKDIAIANAPESDKAHQLGVRKGEIVQPGNLKRNIITKRLKPYKPGREDYIVGVRHGSGKAGKDAFYWRFLEFGRTYSKKGFIKHEFLRPAFDHNKQTAIRRMENTGRSEIERAKRKASRAARRSST